MSPLLCCFKKDVVEFFRNKKNVLINGIIVATIAMVLGTTLLFPTLIEQVVERAPDLISDGSQIDNLMRKLFPQDVKGSMGIWSADAIIFLTIAITLICCNLIPEEIKSGKWILVIQAGYEQKVLLKSKILAYGLCTALPSWIGYFTYFQLSKLFLNDNYSLKVAICNATIFSMAVFSIVVLSVLLSLICRGYITAVITIITSVVAAPDVLTVFSFGRYFPTYILTFLYNSSDCYYQLIFPIFNLIVLIFLLYIVANKKIVKIDIAR